MSFGSISQRLGCVTPKLNYLDLTNNEITEFDLQHFSCAESLTYVYLEGNKLTELSGSLNKTVFPLLRFFDISNNSWKCPHLESLVASLNEMNVMYKIKDEKCSWYSRELGGICCKGTQFWPF